MWNVLETKDVQKGLKKTPVEIRKKYKFWVEVIKNGGSANLKNFLGFKDKRLQGALRECGSSRLNIHYRVVYKKDKSIKEIIVLKVTPHKYEEV